MLSMRIRKTSTLNPAVPTGCSLSAQISMAWCVEGVTFFFWADCELCIYIFQEN